MRQSEALETRHPFVDLRVVLHRAGAERIEAEVDVIVPRREPREVPNDIDLTQFGHGRNVTPQKFRIDDVAHTFDRNIELRKIEGAAAGRAFLEKKRFVQRKMRGRPPLAAHAASSRTIVSICSRETTS